MTNTNNNTGKKFSTFDIFPMQDGFYAIAEGNLTRDPSFSNGEGKKSFISTSMGCGEYPISTRARSVGLPVPEGVNITFANLRFFGKKAEELNAHAKKGDKLVVAGKIGYSKTEKNGNTYHNLDITVDEFFVRPYAEDSYASGGIARFTNVYERNGASVSKPMLANFSGKVLSVDSYEYQKNGVTGKRLRINIRTDKNPKKAYALAIGEKLENAPSDSGYMNVTMFGRNAERAEKCIRKGSWIAFTGDITESRNEDTGKVYYEMVASDFVILKWGPRDEAEANEPNRNNVPATNDAPAADASAQADQPETKTPEEEFTDLDDEDDGELPF